MLVHRVLLLAVFCLGGTVSETKNQPETSEEKIKAISGGAKKLVDDMQSLLNKQKQLAKQRQAISQAKQDLLDRVRTYSKQKTAETLQMLKTYEQELKRYKNQMQQFNESLAQVKKEAEKERAELEKKLDAQIDSLSKEKSALESRLEETKATDTKKMSKLNSTNKDLQHQIQQDKAALDKEAEQYEALKKELDGEEERLRSETVQLKNLKDQLDAEKKALKEDEEKIQELNTQIFEAVKQHEGCTHQVRTLGQALSNESDKADQLRSEITSCESRSVEEQRQVKELTTKLDKMEGWSATCNADLPKAQSTLKELDQTIMKNLKESYDLRETVAERASEVDDLLSTIAALRRKRAAIGEKCNEANTHCMEGLACSDTGVCVPVCREVLAPDVVNARVDWQKVDGAYVGNITCNNASIYTGGSEPLNLVCNPDTGLWKTAMTGNCSQSQWKVGQVEELVQYDVPKQPDVGWGVCLEGKISPNSEHPKPHFSVSLGNGAGKALFRFKFGGKPAFKAELLTGGSWRFPIVHEGKSSFTFEAGKKFKLFLKVTASNVFTVHVDGVKMADIELKDFRGKNIVENVSEVHLAGAIAASYLNLWCGEQ